MLRQNGTACSYSRVIHLVSMGHHTGHTQCSIVIIGTHYLSPAEVEEATESWRGQTEVKIEKRQWPPPPLPGILHLCYILMMNSW